MGAGDGATGSGAAVKTRFRKSSGATAGSGAGATASVGAGALTGAGVRATAGAGTGAAAGTCKGTLTETGAGTATGDATVGSTSGMRCISHGEPASFFLRKKLNMKGGGFSERAGGRAAGAAGQRTHDRQWSGQTGTMQARNVFFDIVPGSSSQPPKLLHIMAGLAL
jgi:hypothetical protein